MTYSEAEIRARVRGGEDSNCEFKQVEFSRDKLRSPKRDDLADEIAALANARGGLLLCGVTDDGDVQGMTREQRTALESLIVEICTDSVKPEVAVHTHLRELDDKWLLIVEVPQGDSLHDSPGGCFVRRGSRKRRMTSDERLRLAQQRGQARFRSFDETTIAGTGIQTLDERLWKPLLSIAGSENPEGGLERLGILALDQANDLRATVAGVLLCTRHPEKWLPNARITATLYRGKDRASGQLDSQEIYGPLDRQISSALTFAARNMRVGARKEPGRIDLPQYSMKAVFEAVVNAVAHRDYSIRTSAIRLSMFEDRLEIQSPGSLPNSLTIDSMASRQATRNEVIASMFGRMSVGEILGSEDRLYFMERRGDGVLIIMRETQALCGQLPEYRLIDGTEALLVIPAAESEDNPDTAEVRVSCGGEPVAGVDVLVLFPNGKWKRAQSDRSGISVVELRTCHMPMTVMAAASGYTAHVEKDWVPARSSLELNLQELSGGGAVIFADGSGRIPGLAGVLTTRMDSLARTSLSASNILINEGEEQPVHFLLGERLHLKDTNGTWSDVRILDVVGRSAIIEYRTEP